MPTAARPFRSFVRMGLCIVVFAAFSACASVPAEYQTSRLALQKGGFSGYKYSFDGSEPEGVHNFFGLYKQSYLDLLADQPEALEEAKLAVPYQYASLGITAVLTIYAFSELAAAGGSDTNTIAGSSEASDHVTRALGATVGMLVAGIVLGIPARNHLFESVGMFNAGLAPPDSDPIDRGLAHKLFSVLPNTVRLNPATRQFDMGWRLRR